ncbi:MAG: hypothetical protein GW914_02050 [Candidatus Aenigmarchaeota archaeon]|nr:hypothetical protein [Candidatus Aenigmarchaeota archaeon]
MDKPRLDKRRHNKKSFNTPRFSINKSENTLKNGKDYIQEIVGLLEEFGIETLKPRIIPYTTRKDGNKTLKICLDFSNRFENLIKLYGKIGYVYCKEREILSKHVLEYLLMKKYIVDMRKESYKKSLKMTRNGIKPMEIYKKIGGKYLSYKNIAMWVEKTNHTFNKIKIPNNFPNFDGWLKGASKGLGDGLVWETIFSIKKVNAENLFDLTTQSSAHTFFSNGFLVSNSGREDVDVRCLGWRPFVLELMKPKKRSVNLNQGLKAINKSKKAQVKDLKLSDKRTVTRIKSIKPDKTYQAEVVFESPVKGLEKLEILQDIVINQETPLRVATRRADKLRRRRVKDIKYKLLNKKKLEMTITAQSGTYIKELIHGDEGRTRPNVADLISNKVKSIKLDVIKIHCD